MFLLQISPKKYIGATKGYIYNDGGGDGETPQEVDQSKWLVAIHHSQPEQLKGKYKNYHDTTVDEKGTFWTNDPTLRVEVI